MQGWDLWKYRQIINDRKRVLLLNALLSVETCLVQGARRQSAGLSALAYLLHDQSSDKMNIQVLLPLSK